MRRRTTLAQNEVIASVPKLPEQDVIVRAVGEAVVYTMEGARIPNDHWLAVPVSPGVIRALQYGDLEEGEEEQGGESDRPRRRRHRQHRRQHHHAAAVE